MREETKYNIIGILLLLIIFGGITILIGMFNNINSNLNQPLEYTYKDFSNKDIELAMKFHGVNSITITETECYFVRDNVKVPLFTDACIEYLYKHKQEEVK
jgi:hypothetical protein